MENPAYERVGSTSASASPSPPSSCSFVRPVVVALIVLLVLAVAVAALAVAVHVNNAWATVEVASAALTDGLGSAAASVAARRHTAAVAVRASNGDVLGADAAVTAGTPLVFITASVAPLVTAVAGSARVDYVYEVFLSGVAGSGASANVTLAALRLSPSNGTFVPAIAAVVLCAALPMNTPCRGSGTTTTAAAAAAATPFVYTLTVKTLLWQRTVVLV
jgi:hypothetical protein